MMSCSAVRHVKSLGRRSWPGDGGGPEVGVVGWVGEEGG